MCENNCILLFCVSAYMKIFRSSDESKVLLDTKTMGKLFGLLAKILIFSITLSSNHALFNFFFFFRENYFQPLEKFNKERKVFLYFDEFLVSSENFESVETAASYLDKNWIACTSQIAHSTVFFSERGSTTHHLFPLKSLTCCVIKTFKRFPKTK